VNGGRPPFVLVHGGGQGGWVWREVAAELRARGHEVFTPSLTGFGERRHLEPASFETFVDDIANVILVEDLDDVVLVGHSMGGVVIPRVAERVADRIRRVVWVTAVVTADGETLLDAVPQSPAIARAVQLGPGGIAAFDAELLLDAGIHDGTAEQRDFIRRRRHLYPSLALVEPGRLTAFLELGLPTAYVVATDDRTIEPHVQERFVARLPGARRAEIAAGHQCMNTQPARLSDILASLAR
jgi:pimeloyl-ACP methyl ester carboxylesterase